MAAAGLVRAASLGFSAALLAGSLLPASPALGEDAVPSDVLFLQSDRAEDSWPRELEAALDDAGPARAHLVARCAVADDARAVDSCLDVFRPRLIVALRAPPSPAAEELRARGLPLLLAPVSPTDAAREILSRAPEAAPASRDSTAKKAASYKKIARVHFEFGDHAGAKANLQRALALVPDDFDALELLFRAEMRGGWVRDAERYADRGAAVAGLTDSRRAAILTGRARARALLGDGAAAEQDLKEALRLRPRDAEASFRLAQAARDRPQEALPYAELAARAAETDGRRAAARRLAAMIRLDLGDETGARKSLESAPRTPGQELDALQSSLRLARGRPSEAAAIAEGAVRAAERSPLWVRPAAYRLCARLWFESKNYPKALESLKAALALAPDDLYTLEAMVQIKRERPNDSLDFAAPAPAAGRPAKNSLPEAELLRELHSDPEDLDALSRLIELARGRGRIPDELRYAARFMDAAREASPWRQPAAYRFIARVWSDLGDDANVQIALGLARDLDRRSIEFEELAQPLRRPDSREAVYVANRVAAYVAIAQARAELGDAAKAEISVRLALAQDPAAASALRLLARLEFDRGRPREALADADRLVEASGKASAGERADGERLRAMIQLALGEGAAAETSLERTLALAPGDLEALRLLVRIELDDGRPRRALDFVVRLVDATRTAPAERRADARIQEARIRLALKDDDGAARSLEGALALDPGALPALELLSDLRLSQNRPHEALKYAGRLVAAAENAPPAERADARRRRARVQLALADVSGARKSLEETLALDGDARPGLMPLIQLELVHGRPREALAYADRLVEACGDASPAVRAADERQRARIQLTLGDDAAAETSLKSALALDPAGTDAPRLLLRIEQSRGRPREALAYASRLVDASAHAPPAERADAYRERARLRLQLGDEDGARMDFGRALDLSPEDLASLWMIVSGPHERPREAMELVKTHRPVAPSLQAPWLVLRGMASAMLDDRVSARGDFDAAVKADSTAVCYGDLAGDRRDQFDPLLFTRCLNAFPASASLYSDRGVARYRSGRTDEAISDFRKAVELKPNFLEARLSLATALAAQGRRAEAADEANRALAMPAERAGPVYRQLSALRDSLGGASRSTPPAAPPR